MVTDEDVQELLKVHRYQEDLFFDRDAFEAFCDWLTVLIMWELNQTGKKAGAVGIQSAAEVVTLMNFMPVLAAKAGYKLDLFFKKLAQFSSE